MATGLPDTVTATQDPNKLYQTAQDQVNSEVAGQVAPIQSQLGDTQQNQLNAVEQASKVYGDLMPFVAGSAQRVEQMYNQGQQVEKGIFDNATAKLNGLANARAQEAQRMAQEMGGPVALSEFMAATNTDQAIMPHVAAGEQLHALANAQIGSQEAEAFAGKVFPMMKAEAIQNINTFYNQKISDLQDQMAAIKQSGSGEINKRYNDLLQQERQYQLDQLKANRDWKATQHTLKNDDVRLRLAQTAARLDEADRTGMLNGKPTLDKQKLTADQKNQAIQLGITEDQMKLQVAKLEQAGKIAEERLAVNRQKNAISLLDAATNPSTDKPVSMTVRQEVDATHAYLDKSAFSEKGKDGTTHYYKWVHLTLTPDQWSKYGIKAGGAGTQDPQSLYNVLIQAGTPPAMAANLVRSRLGLKKWKPKG